MTDESPERRRNPRLAGISTPELRLGGTVRVRIVELSADGALLWTDEDVPSGTTGKVTVVLGGVPFEGYVAVTRQQPDNSSHGNLLGVTLRACNPQQRRTLERFLDRRGM